MNLPLHVDDIAPPSSGHEVTDGRSMAIMLDHGAATCYLAPLQNRRPKAKSEFYFRSNKSIHTSSSSNNTIEAPETYLDPSSSLLEGGNDASQSDKAFSALGLA
ncbi:hypothetical protein MMC17_005091 [Xylographa soralifera]|nr:hypothetical protein [Xylographa soralifera]